MSESIFQSPELKPSQAGDPSVINPSVSAEQRREAAIDTRTRVPMSVPQARLSSPELPGFHLHWMNDEPGRLEQAIKAGYAFVEKEEAVLISADLAGTGVGSGTDLGSRVSNVVGRDANGHVLRAYLMKIRQDWFDADQQGIQQRVNDSESAIRSGRQRVEGENNAADMAARYVKQHKVSTSRSA